MWPFKRSHTKSQPGKRLIRGFDAAAIGRFTSSWVTFSNSIDWDIRRSLNVLRARSRDATINNPYGKKYMQMCQTHIVGPRGFTLQVKVKLNTGKPDKLANDAIESAFYKWAKKGNCDVTGNLSFFDIQRLMVQALCRDGEFLARKIIDKNSEFPYQLQLLDIDRLDTEKNEELAGGNIIKMGVELNRYGKSVAYWIKENHPGDGVYYINNHSVYVRVPADEIIHLFIPDRPEQTRGFPWTASGLERLKSIDAYQEAAIIAARVGAAKMGHYTSPDGDAGPLADEKTDDGQLMADAEAGVLQVLPPGYGFESFNPDYPHQMYADFVKTGMRDVSSGLGVAYNTLSNDLEGVNFSSIRTGVLEERDNWMTLQNWIIESFLDGLYSEWLLWALVKGSIKLPSGASLPSSGYDRFNVAIWQGRRWQWVDPTKDVEANVTAINNGLKSRHDVIAEQGKDIDDVFTDIQSEQEQMAEMGIKVQGAVNPVNDTKIQNE
jgi:lambda family phage portal protein